MLNGRSWTHCASESQSWNATGATTNCHDSLGGTRSVGSTTSRYRRGSNRAHGRRNELIRSANPMVRSVAVFVLSFAFIACDGTPTAPSSGVPNVAGTYTGTLYLTSSQGSQRVPVEMQMVVVQSGSQLTITASMSLGGQTVDLPAITGTINRTGFFTVTAGGYYENTTDDVECGRITPTSSSLTFSGRTARYQESADSQHCGTLQLSGTLTRRN